MICTSVCSKNVAVMIATFLVGGCYSITGGFGAYNFLKSLQQPQNRWKIWKYMEIPEVIFIKSASWMVEISKFLDA